MIRLTLSSLFFWSSVACCLVAQVLIVRSVFGARRRTKGLRFEATDVDWSWGDGPTVRGPGEALVMAMLGRAHPLPELDGDGLATFGPRV